MQIKEKGVVVGCGVAGGGGVGGRRLAFAALKTHHVVNIHQNRLLRHRGLLPPAAKPLPNCNLKLNSQTAIPTAFPTPR